MQVSVGETLQSNIAIPQMQKGDRQTKIARQKSPDKNRQTKIARQKKPGGDRNWPPGSLVSC